jgi:hypothetical protein
MVLNLPVLFTTGLISFLRRLRAVTQARPWNDAAACMAGQAMRAGTNSSAQHEHRQRFCHKFLSREDLS